MSWCVCVCVDGVLKDIVWGVWWLERSRYIHTVHAYVNTYIPVHTQMRTHIEKEEIRDRLFVDDCSRIYQVSVGICDVMCKSIVST